MPEYYYGYAYAKSTPQRQLAGVKYKYDRQREIEIVADKMTWFSEKESFVKLRKIYGNIVVEEAWKLLNPEQKQRVHQIFKED